MSSGNNTNIITSSCITEERKNFYQAFLQPHEGTEDIAWMVSILARRKYDPAFSQGSACVAREILRAHDMTEERFLQLLDLAEFRASQSKDRKTGQPIPRKAWVCYIAANMLDESGAFFALKKQMDDRVTDMAKASKKGTNGDGNARLGNPACMYKTLLVQNPRRQYIKLDVDTKDPKHLEQLGSILSDAGVSVTHTVRTRGGFHVLLPCGGNLKKVKDFVSKVVKEYGKQNAWVTFEAPTASPYLAVPGTFQSEHVPVMVEWGPELWISGEERQDNETSPPRNGAARKNDETGQQRNVDRFLTAASETHQVPAH